jgi:hypothetical protein
MLKSPSDSGHAEQSIFSASSRSFQVELGCEDENMAQEVAVTSGINEVSRRIMSPYQIVPPKFSPEIDET